VTADGYLPRVSRAWSVVLCGALGACAERAPVGAPPTEFLLATRDSMYWVTSGGGEVRMRGAALTLARVGDRFVELYAADDDRSYYDAVLVSQRLFARDVVRGDSTVIAADTLVPALATAYQQRFPDERPLAPDEDASDRPRILGTADLVPLDVVGPFVVVDQRVAIDVIGGDDRHRAERAVYDLRDATRAELGALFPAPDAARLVATGARQAAAWRAAALRRRDRTAGSAGFDPRSFEPAATDMPAVRFVLAVDGPDPDVTPPALDPLPAPAPPWWPDAAPELPSRDTAGAHWRRGRLRVDATPVDGRRERLAIAQGDAPAWRVGVVTGPVRRIHWLDGPAVDAATRRALARAFDESALYDERTRVAAAGGRPSRRSRPAGTARATFAAHGR
jgi:hypothetical protein